MIPELTHTLPIHGCTIRHTLDNNYAVMVDRDGAEKPFAVDLGMIAQGSDSATLLAIKAAKADKQAREQAEREERQRKRAERQAHTIPTPAEAVADSPADDDADVDTDVLLDESEGDK